MILRLYLALAALCALILAPKRLLLYFNKWVLSVEDMRWRRIAFPLVKQVFPDLVAKEFVSVQPMSEPSGVVFYMDLRHVAPTHNPVEVYSDRVKRGYQTEAPLVIHTHDTSR